MPTSKGFQGTATPAPCHLAYVIFSMQRSGTTTLCRDLRRLKMNCMFELFNWGKHNAGHKWGTLLNVSDEEAMRSPMQYVDRVMRAENASRQVGHTIARLNSTRGPTAAQCRSGFKLFPDQAITPKVAAGLTTTCVIYRRQNVSAQYLSWKRAVTFGGSCWGVTPLAQRYCNSTRPVTIGNDFPAFQQRVASWYLEVEEACVGKTVVKLTMEGHLVQTKGLLKIANLL